jgi:uncharacterized protein YceH (UPF0502 family)
MPLLADEAGAEELVVVEVLALAAGLAELELDFEPDEPHPATASAAVTTAAASTCKRGSLMWPPVSGWCRCQQGRRPRGFASQPPLRSESLPAGRPAAPKSILGPVHIAELSGPEQRVLGCLIEKRWTTPDQYPLSLNGLRMACNQTTNRDPVTDYDEATVREAAQRLSLYGLARLASGHGSRAVKYRHLAEEALGLGREELAVLAILLLRGPQTPGELKARTERMAHFDSLAQIEQVLATLSERGYATRLHRQPGQKEDRFMQLLGGEAEAPPSPPPVVTAERPEPDGSLAERVAALEAEVSALRAEVARLSGERAL